MPYWKSMTAKEKFDLENKHVKVVCHEGIVHKGVVFTLDPVTESLVIQTEQQVVIVNGAFILEVFELREEVKIFTNLEELLNDEKKVSNPKIMIQVSKKRDQIAQWLKLNKFPVSVQQNGVIQVAGVCTIEPPYNDNCIFSTNELVLNSVKMVLIKQRF